jgi:AraC family transcriptional regulator of adaptative response/methylated-DNA-[protein]-cysteine methyltransferase
MSLGNAWDRVLPNPNHAAWLGMDRTPSQSVLARQRLASLTERDPRWVSVCARDHGADGTFFYAVKTTGVYCRPSCAARRPRPENVSFYASRDLAERDGFRPCKRCKPDQSPHVAAQAAKIVELCRMIERSEHVPPLEELAAYAGLSGYHLLRTFKAITGVTPHEYARAQRASRVRRELAQARSVTEAIYNAGYHSAARFYEDTSQVLGMTPTKFRAGGAGLAIRFAIGECSLGSILVAATERGVCAISLGDDPEQLAHELERQFPRAQLIGADEAFERLVALVVGLVENPRAAPKLPLDIRGTVFQQRVWSALMQIPAGETVSYKELATELGAPQASRAVARACASNRLAVAIPCHRVVRTDGDVSGYRWGVERKRALLARESQDSERMA